MSDSPPPSEILLMQRQHAEEMRTLRDELRGSHQRIDVLTAAIHKQMGTVERLAKEVSQLRGTVDAMLLRRERDEPRKISRKPKSRKSKQGS